MLYWNRICAMSENDSVPLEWPLTLVEYQKNRGSPVQAAQLLVIAMHFVFRRPGVKDTDLDRMKSAVDNLDIDPHRLSLAIGQLAFASRRRNVLRWAVERGYAPVGEHISEIMIRGFCDSL